MRPSALDRFMSKVRKNPDGCWHWVAAKNPKGYGVFYYQGKQQGSPRVSLMLFRGASLRTEDFVCHSCDVPACVNPDHLWVGTQKDNIRDMHAKGRDYNGHDRITHCPSGHEYSAENTRIYQNKRHCRQCDRDRNKGNEARRLAALMRNRRRRSVNSARTHGVL